MSLDTEKKKKSQDARELLGINIELKSMGN